MICTRAKSAKQLFDRRSLDLDKWFTANRNTYPSDRAALQVAQLRGAVLDLAVDSGAFDALGVTLGVGVSLEMLKISKRNGLEVVQAGVTHLSIRDETFDTVVSSFIVCFVNNVAAALSESKRVLRERGKLMLGEIPRDSSGYGLRGEG